MALATSTTRQSQFVTDALCGIFLVSLLYSKFMLSVSMFGICLYAIYLVATRGRPFFHSSLLPYMAPALLFVAVLISGINSEDTTEWLGFIRKRLPFLVLPPAFFILNRELHRSYYRYVMIWVWLCFTSVFFVLGYYILHTSDVHDAISRGQSLPTPVDHIKYSIYLAFACISAFIIHVKKIYLFSPREKRVYLPVAVFLFIALHIMAVRSGIAVLYTSIFLVGSYLLVVNRKWAIMAAFLALFFLLPYAAYKTLPTFHRKISYMLYDLDKYRSGEGLQYSDSERLFSYQVGWQLFSEHPVLGTGIGDLKKESRAKYKSIFDIDLGKYPHNQFLFTLAGMGIVGFLLMLVGMIYPIAAYRQNLEIVFIAFNIIIFCSFIVENTLERSYSTAFYLFFLLAGISYISKE